MRSDDDTHDMVEAARAVIADTIADLVANKTRSSDRNPHFRERDLKRAVRALEALGKQIVRVEIEGARLIVVTPQKGGVAAEEINPWDAED
jgi:hypothetical protein